MIITNILKSVKENLMNITIDIYELHYCFFLLKML